MAEPFLAEIRIFAFNFPPRNWAFCDGQILPIDQNQSLFSLLGTTFGGDGRTSFGLPDLRGRTPAHIGTGISWGQKLGEETHSLQLSEIPSHTHAAQASTASGDAPIPTTHVLASANNVYGGAANLLDIHSQTIASAGTGAGHPNMQPYIALEFCIALSGLFPSRN